MELLTISDIGLRSFTQNILRSHEDRMNSLMENDLGKKPGCSAWVMLGPKGDRTTYKPPKPEHDVIIRRSSAHATPHKDGFSGWLLSTCPICSLIKSSNFGEATRDFYGKDPWSPTFGEADRDSFGEDPQLSTFSEVGQDSVGDNPKSPTFDEASQDSSGEDPQSLNFGEVDRDSFGEDPRSPTFGEANWGSFGEDPQSLTFGEVDHDYFSEIHNHQLSMRSKVTDLW
ncbi:hypothetical protein V8G54_035664 [Vigna mungo]|uniref:Uncharacterized protein n=1 Tax=Vigna mungo TaxID=3915 RepID=A0AAQ3MFH8_VIGMU